MTRRHGWLAIRLLIACAMLTALVARTQSTFAVSSTIVISQVYGGGGNTGAPFTHDYIELFNRGTTTVSLAGWSIQYASATGTGNFGANAAQITELTGGSLAPGQYFLVQEAGGTIGSPLPTPDVIDTTPIAMSATGGKVALVNTTTPLGCNGSSTPCSSSALANIIDLVGYGSANFYEGSGAAPAPSNTTDAIRIASGCADTDNNATDFITGAPAPRNSASPLNPCSTPPPTTVPPTPTTVPPTPTPTPPPAPTFIREIQGSSHISPKSGQLVANVPGIVTAKALNSFYIQDPNPDANDATSEGILVFTSSAPTVNVGDAVLVSGRVTEFRAGGSASTNLTITEITGPTVSVTSTGNPLPAATIIGNGGRVPPATVIEDDVTGSVETSGTFDPASDGIDFYESLEGMRVQVNNAVAVGPSNRFGEIPVVGDNGANAGLLTPRGGIIIRPNDFNPERIILDDVLMATPAVNVGDRFSTPVMGVIDYGFGNFKLQVTSALTGVSSGLDRESTTPAGYGELAVATFNVENLDPGDGAAKFDTLADLIVNNLQAPDIIAIEEAQDNNGPVNDSVVDATQTFNVLIAAIQNAGGPTYDFRNIDPADDQDGGEPGGNIRVGFLFRTDRGVSFIDRPGGTATAATTVVNTANGPELSFSPGRIDPTNSAFSNSRKPLIGEFSFNGQKLFVIANHFNSKGGDQALFGRFQPPTRSSEIQRKQQSQIVNTFVDAILAADPNARIVAAGDFNDFQFSESIAILKGGVLHDLIDTLPENERYSYVFEGNAQTLDHILVSGSLLNALVVHDVVHVNAEFADQSSDHDPQVSRFSLNTPPTVSANGPYSVNEGGSVTLNAAGNDLEGGPLSYAWDLDNNGSFETSGQSANFSAANLDGPTSRTVAVQVTDLGGLTAVGQATIAVLNAPPTVAAPANQTTTKGAATTFQLGSFADPGPDAPWAVDVNWGDGSAPTTLSAASAGSLGSASHTYANVGLYTVTITVTDKDGGSGTATFQVSVVYVFNGFFEPIDNLPTFNVVSAGRSIPVKFSLNGNQGLNIFESGYPKSQEIACDATAPTDGVEETVTSGGSSLSYDASTDQYTYVWKTDKSWAGTCRQLVVKLDDGTFHRANFQFSR